MTPTPDPKPPSGSSPARGDGAKAHRGAFAVAEVCPYLVAEAGGWRSAYPAKEHRCAAVDPPVPVAAGKQRTLCLVDGHRACATYAAARAREGSGPTAEPADDDLWPAVHSTPLILEPAHAHGVPMPAPTRRAVAQLLLAGLMVVAFLVLALPRLSGSGPGGATPVPSPGGSSSPGATVGTTPPPSSSLAPSPSSSAGPSPAPSSSPSPTGPPSPVPSPSIATTTYRVQSGDTLVSIAAQLGTTVKVLVDLNGITDPTLIRVGQVLVVPAP